MFFIVPSSRAEYHIEAQDEMFVWVFIESSERVKADRFSTIHFNLVKILLADPAPESWTWAVGHGFVRPSADEKMIAKKNPSQIKGTKGP